MTTLIIGLLTPVLIVGAIIIFFVRRGLQIKELCDHGIETTGHVEGKRTVKPSNSGARQKKLEYRYTDSTGATRRHTSVVPIDIYDRYDEGSPIEIVYSSKHPDISAPRYLIDQARQAMRKP